MKIVINAVAYAEKVAWEHFPGKSSEDEEWIEIYDETFNRVTSSLEDSVGIPIKLLGTKEFCKLLGLDTNEFLEAYYQLDLNLTSISRKDAFNNEVFKFLPISNEEGKQLDMAINSLHPCLIKMIFAYLQRPELIDRALEIIANYEEHKV